MPCSYSHQITIEKSPNYFLCNLTAERINRIDPNMKIIVTLRDPIVRIESQFAMMCDVGKLSNISFKDVVTKRDIHNKTVIDTNILIRRSDYATQVKPWLKQFQRKQILFVDGDNFIKNPSQELNKVEEFLGVKQLFTLEKFQFNEAKGMYCFVSNKSRYCLSSRKGRAHQPYGPDVRKL